MVGRGRAVARFTLPALLGLLLVGVIGPGLLAAQGPEDVAQAAAESWLKLVDTGQYGESWEQAASLFRNAITRDQWKQAVKGVRDPLGKVVSRKVKSRQFTEHLPGAPDGKYVGLQFDTVFANKASAVETITPMLDKDGAWRVSGYFVK
jgi:Protein of unknown function (DUF4019)